MPKTPRGKRVVDSSTGDVVVHGKAANGEGGPYFDKSRGVWVAPWRRPDGKIGRPTGKTRVLAEASPDRHIEAAREGDRLAKLKEGFHAQSTLGELIHWWLDHIARHRVRATTFATYSKQLRLVESKLGSVLVRSLRPEQLTTFISGIGRLRFGAARRSADGSGSASRPHKDARHISTLRGRRAELCDRGWTESSGLTTGYPAWPPSSRFVAETCDRQAAPR